MNSYIEIVPFEKKPKTMVYVIRSLKNDDVLGQIKWYNGWRRYVFMPIDDVVFDSLCLGKIKDFIDNLMKERETIRDRN